MGEAPVIAGKPDQLPEPSSLSHARRPLGKSGLTIPPMAWGMWRFRGANVAAAQTRVEAAIEAGLDLFDTADVYGLDNGAPFGAAETLLGRVLRGSPMLRQRIVLATKGGIEIGAPYNSSADYLVRACEASLRRLGVDQIDLYQIHRPDMLTHPAEAARSLEALRQAGKIREAGVSNHTPAQVAALVAHLPFPLASIQPEFSPLALVAVTDGVLDQAMQLGLAVLAWSPLAGGRLGQPKDPRSLRIVAALSDIARTKSCSVTVAAYAWVMAHPARPVPIVGTQTPGRILEAKQAADIGFTRQEWYGVYEASLGEKLP